MFETHGRCLLSSVPRQNNIALLEAYGANKWRVHNFLLEATAKGLEASLEQLKAKTTDVNRERKQFQVGLIIRLIPVFSAHPYLGCRPG